MNPTELVKAITAAQAEAGEKLSQGLKDLVTSFELFRRSQIWTPYNSGDKCKDMLLYRGPCWVRSITVYNASATTSEFLQVFNTVSAPPDGYKTLLPPLALPPGATEFYDMGSEGLYLSTGLYVCGSTTDIAKTLIGSNDFFFFALLRPDLP